MSEKPLDGRQGLQKPRVAPSTSLQDIHKALGLQRKSLEGCLAATRAGLPLDAFSAKEQMGALEALLIEDIWPEIDAWIKAHSDVYGFMKTNLPDLRGYMIPTFENHLPNNESALTFSAITAAEIEKLKLTIDTLKEREIPPLLEPYVRDVLHTFLFRWELRRLQEKSRHSEPTPGSPLQRYDQYLNLVAAHIPQISEFRYPVTKILQSGFAFGPAVFLVLPLESELALGDKLAHTHNMIMRYLGLALETTPAVEEHESSRGESRFTIAPGLLAAMLDNIDMPKAAMEREQRLGNPTAMPIITGCSAWYTPMFAGVREWIVGMKKGLIWE